jgi:hypothetical protein
MLSPEQWLGGVLLYLPFFAFLAARFSFNVLAGFFFASFFVSLALLMVSPWVILKNKILDHVIIIIRLPCKDVNE